MFALFQLHFLHHSSAHCRNYRYYLFNSTIWNYMFTSLLLVVNPVFLFPSLCVVSNSLRLIDYNEFNLTFYLILFSMINLALSISCSLVYRFSQAFYGSLQRLHDSKWSLGLHVLHHLFFHVVILGSLYSQQLSGLEQNRLQFAIENPDLVVRFEDNSVICYTNTERTRSTILYISFFLLLFFVLCTILLIHLVFTLRSKKRNFRSYHLHLMLFKVLVIQLHIVYAFFLVPIYFICLLIYFQHPHTSYFMMITSELISAHCWIEYSCVLYFIVPYRKTILKVLKKRSRTSQLITTVVYQTES
ncbi:hypothetical protein M3Y98_00086900 [Aphelenchoides besseyi]|nr:hypothetical protein M3Y98_00086900 [Aphelenchoides besseyi]KAI6198468.1 hypothetical protein M3Y96_00522400 [Aphelenchoides besseyi]